MGTHYKGTDKEERALNVFIKLMRASESLTSNLYKQLSDHNLTMSQFGVLEALLHLGPLNQRALGEKLLKSGGNITLVIDNLEKNNWVERKPNPDDRRSVLIHLTEEGRSFIESYFPKHVDNIVKEFSVLTAEEQEQLGTLCKKLGTNISE